MLMFLRPMSESKLQTYVRHILKICECRLVIVNDLSITLFFQQSTSLELKQKSGFSCFVMDLL